LVPTTNGCGPTKRFGASLTLRGLRMSTFASQWVVKGGDLFKLQKILGHQSVQMTMRYAHLAPDAFREDYGRLG